MKVLYVVALAYFQLNTVFGQHLQGSETTLLRQRLLARTDLGSADLKIPQRFARALVEKKKKYGSVFLDPGYNGFCRTLDNSAGRYLTYHGVSEDECVKKCASDNTFEKKGVGAICTAYEYQKSKKKCEVHYDGIGRVKTNAGDDVKCVLANDGGCLLTRKYAIFFSRGGPGFSFCRVGKTKGTYTVCEECKSRGSCEKKCNSDDKCVAFEFSEVDGGTCEIHTDRPTGVAKTHKKSFCYVKRSQPVETCFIE